MRLQKSSGIEKPNLTGFPLVLHVAHNLVYWFFLIPFLTPMSYETGFLIYTLILFTRFVANTYINVRDLSPEEYYKYPLRIP